MLFDRRCYKKVDPNLNYTRPNILFKTQLDVINIFKDNYWIGLKLTLKCTNIRINFVLFGSFETKRPIYKLN